MTIKKTAAAATTALFLLFAGCSNLDDTTDLGAGLVKGQESFDASNHKLYSASIDTSKTRSFQDDFDTALVAIEANKNLCVGTFSKLKTVSYLDFNNKALYNLDSTIKAEGGNVIEFSFKFAIDSSVSDPQDMFIELGRAYLKNKIERFNLDSISPEDEIGHVNTSTMDENNECSITLDTDLFKLSVDTTGNSVLTSYYDTTTNLSVKSFKHIVEKKITDTTITLDTLDAFEDSIHTNDYIILHYGNKAFKQEVPYDTLYYICKVSDSTVVDSSDTLASSLPDSLFIKVEELTNTILYLAKEQLKETYLFSDTCSEYAIYDTITPIEELIAVYGQKDYLLSGSSLLTTPDTIKFQNDTLYTKKDTAITVKQVSVSTPNGTFYDTTYYKMEVSIDTVYQNVKIERKTESLLDKILDSNFVEITDGDTISHITFYLNQINNNSDILKFIKSPRLEIRYTKNEGIDTLAAGIKPIYVDYSVIEEDSATVSSIPTIVASADRMIQLALDVKDMWRSMTDSATGIIKYKNIPKMTAQIFTTSDPAVSHLASEPEYVRFLYNLSDSPITSLWEKEKPTDASSQIRTQYTTDTLSLSRFKDSNEDTLTLELDEFMPEFVNIATDTNSVPDTLYLTIKLSDNSFTKLKFKDDSYNLDYIISNLKEGFEND